MPLFQPSTPTVDMSGPLGFFGATPVHRPTGYTAGYTETNKALPAYTPNVKNTAFTGGLLDLLQAARLVDLNAIRIALENLRVLAEGTAQQHNALVEDLRKLGLIE